MREIATVNALSASAVGMLHRKTRCVQHMYQEWRSIGCDALDGLVDSSHLAWTRYCLGIAVIGKSAGDDTKF